MQAHVKLGAAFTGGPRGLLAARDIAPGEAILIVPSVLQIFFQARQRIPALSRMALVSALWKVTPHALGLRPSDCAFTMWRFYIDYQVCCATPGTHTLKLFTL